MPTLSYLKIFQSEIFYHIQLIRKAPSPDAENAKYYTRTMQYNPLYNSTTLHSNNMYRIYSYVKNYDTGHNGDVAGMLLYARTDEEVQPDKDYMISGNKICVKTLDLNQEFKFIAKQLKDITHVYLGV